jgi:hypothetical protein
MLFFVSCHEFISNVSWVIKPHLKIVYRHKVLIKGRIIQGRRLSGFRQNLEFRPKQGSCVTGPTFMPIAPRFWESKWHYSVFNFSLDLWLKINNKNIIMIYIFQQIHKICKITAYLYTWILLRVSSINHSPQGNVNPKSIKLIHQIYIFFQRRNCLHWARTSSVSRLLNHT